jgi:DNA-directed RNA polymerase specialized sigma24 family protein
MRKVHPDAVAETYNDTERLLYHTIHQFVAAKGGSFEDLKEYAGLYFVNAYHRYNRDKQVRFSTWLRFSVWHSLLELYRKRARNEHKVVFMDLQPEAYETPKQFNHLEFVESLSNDAQLVVRLVFDTAWQLQPEPAEVKRLLWEYLRQPAIGWPAARIRETFAEIRCALGGL